MINEVEQLEQAIAALQSQRALLGEAVVEAALVPLREKLATLQKQASSEQRKLVTVLFADLIGFTAWAEQLDPEDVREIIDAYFTQWAKRIEEYGGVVEKFIGDAMMAVFGLQTAQEDDSERAVWAGLSMRDALAELNQQLESERGISLSMRVGIHTGQVVVSLFGDRYQRRSGQDFVVVGDTVNLASRLQTSAPENSILISQDTFHHVRGVFDMQAQAPIQVKGKKDPILTYLVTAAKARPLRFEKLSGETPLVGRMDELQAMQNALQHSIDSGRQEMVMLVGEAGIGKSRLVYEFENGIEFLPFYVMYFKGRASPYLRKQPYSLWRDLFASRFQIQDSDPPLVVCEKFENGINVPGNEEGGIAAAHFIGQMLGFDFGESPYLQGVKDNAQQLYERGLAYLADYFRTRTLRVPVVILLDDLQWADESSLALIAALRPRLAEYRLMIVGVARPELLEREAHSSLEQEPHTRLDLGPLSEAESVELVDQILHKVDDLPHELYKLIINSAEGNPFFIEELIRMLIDDGVIVQAEDDWFVEVEKLSRVRVPPTLTEFLQARFDSLPLEERNLLQRAAVVGRVFWDQAVDYLTTTPSSAAFETALPVSPSHAESIAAAPSTSAKTIETLNLLREYAIILRKDQSSFEGTQEYAFTHALFRDVTYESLLRRQRRTYHAYAARWLERVTEHSQRTGEYAALIAEHYELAEEEQQAAYWYARAGELASKQYANTEAVHNLSRALDLLAQEDPARRFELLMQRENVYDRQGKRQAQERDLEALAQLAEQIDDPGRRVEVAIRQAWLAFQVGDYEPACTAAQQAIELAQSIGDRIKEVDGRVLMGKALMWPGNNAAATAQFEQALEQARAAGLAGFEAEILWNMSIAASNTSHYAQATRLLQQALEIYRTIGDQAGEGVALGQMGVVFLTQGEHRKAKENFEAAIAIMRKMGLRLRESILLQNLGVLNYEQGNYAEAQRLHMQALQIYREMNDKYGISASLANLGDVSREEGCYAEARSFYEQGLEQARSIGDRLLQGLVLANLSLLYVQTGDFPSGVQAGQQAYQVFHDLETRLYEAFALTRTAQALLELDRLEEAAQDFQQALQIQEELNLANNAIESHAGLARVAMARQDLALAEAHVEQILAQLENNDLAGTDEPMRIFLTCYQVLAYTSNGWQEATEQNSRARQVLRQGYDLLQRRAAQIVDPELKQAFLENVILNRQVRAAWEEGLSPHPPGLSAQLTNRSSLSKESENGTGDPGELTQPGRKPGRPVRSIR